MMVIFVKCESDNYGGHEHTSYLSFFLHRQNFWKLKFTPKFTQYFANLHSKLPIFCVKSVKIYTGQKKFTRAPPVVPVTNMRYDIDVYQTPLLGQRQIWWPDSV